MAVGVMSSMRLSGSYRCRRLLMATFLLDEHELVCREQALVPLTIWALWHRADASLLRVDN